MTKEQELEEYHELCGLLNEADIVYHLSERYDQGYLDMPYERYTRLRDMLQNATSILSS